jgi:hypothetical protein
VERLSPTSEERAAFHSGNAAKLYFSQPAAIAPLVLPFDPQTRARSFPATRWANGLPVDQALAGRMVYAWLAAGGKGNLGTFVEKLLNDVLPPLPTSGDE